MAETDLFEDPPLASGTHGEPANPETRKKGTKTLEQLKLRFTDFQDLAGDARKEQETNYSYYYKKGQLTREEREKLADRGQPTVIINRFRVAINGILGVISRSATDPRALPKTPNDEDAADVVTDILRFVEQFNRFDNMKKHYARDFLLGGVCAVLVGVDDDRMVEHTPVRWEEFYYDPRSRRHDFKDARYLGIAKWFYKEQLLAMRPEDFEEKAWNDMVASAMDGSVIGTRGGATDDTFEDRPLDQNWIDAKTNRVMVIEHYEVVNGKWRQFKFWGGGVISDEESPYLNAKGRPCCPIVATSCYVDMQNNRQGYGLDLIDLQDEINKRRSKALWEISSSQIQAADPSAIEVDSNTARREAARPDGVIPYGWAKVPSTDRTAGNMQLLAEAKTEMERFSPNPAMLGRQGSDTSGRALLARQQAGLVELAVVLDEFEDWELRVWEQSWARAKQYWTEEMVLRVTEDFDSYKFIHLNVPIMPPAPAMGGGMAPGGPGEAPGGPMEGVGGMLAPAMGEGGPVAPGGPPEGPPLDGTGQGMVPSMPEGIQLEGVLGYENSVAEMDVDIIIDTVPETATIMAEQLTELGKLLGSNPNYAQEVPFEVVLEMTTLPRKRQLIAKIRAHKEAQAAAQQQQMQRQQAMEDAQLQSTLQLEASEAERNRAEGFSKVKAAEQGDIRTATQADKTLSGIETEEARANMDGTKTTLDVLEFFRPKPATGDTGGQDAAASGE